NADGADHGVGRQARKACRAIGRNQAGFTDASAKRRLVAGAAFTSGLRRAAVVEATESVLTVRSTRAALARTTEDRCRSGAAGRAAGTAGRRTLAAGAAGPALAACSARRATAAAGGGGSRVVARAAATAGRVGLDAD